jgi:hypothetical protein
LRRGEGRGSPVSEVNEAMARYRVFVGGRALVSYLELPLWETARRALRLLADEPRPRWAAPTTNGFVFYLEDLSWVAYDVDDERLVVAVLGAGASRVGREVVREAEAGRRTRGGRPRWGV